MVVSVRPVLYLEEVERSLQTRDFFRFLLKVLSPVGTKDHFPLENQEHSLRINYQTKPPDFFL